MAVHRDLLKNAAALTRRGRMSLAVMVLAALLLGLLVTAAITEAWPALLACIVIAGLIIGIEFYDLRRLRRALTGLHRRVERVDERAQQTTRRLNTIRATVSADVGARLEGVAAANERADKTIAAVALAFYHSQRQNSGPRDVDVSEDLMEIIVDQLLKRGDALDAYLLLASSNRLIHANRTLLRRLRTQLRRRGYLNWALEVAQAVVREVKLERDIEALRWIRAEIAVLTGAFVPEVATSERKYTPRPRRVLHVVGNSLPHKQSGYTLRTHYTAVAQLAAGLDPHVVTQAGFGHEGDDFASEQIDGVTYHRVPGPPRGKERSDLWLRKNAQGLANLVRIVRPAVLHAASDFLNALTAKVVGDELGIPVVYESRGFWEETWLSRQAQSFGWDLASLEKAYGLPDVYAWRRDIEKRLRREVRHVVTLDDVMADVIVAGGVNREQITVVPNAVDTERFPVIERNQELATQLGFAKHTTIIGYISSIVEYEGIDTLIAAYGEVAKKSVTPVGLLIVGDGPVLGKLKAQAKSLGVDNVVFTGAVPHEDVLNYYSLIDIFVVPRRPVEVCHLVTPLKPFEALSTGRTVVLSDVRALTSIAKQSKAVELFQAGDHKSLATVLTALIDDDRRRKELSAAGAAWVRATRTWRANADLYVRLYEELGVVHFGELHIAQLSARGIDIDGLRQVLSNRDRIPYEHLASDDVGRNADEIIADGWKLGSHPTVILELPIDWNTLCMANRSWNFHLHAWDFMAPVLGAYSRTGNRQYLDWCIDRAVSWATRYNDGPPNGTMAWYDMALGLRGHRLAYLVEQAVINGLEEEKLRHLLSCVVRHQQEFFEEHAFNPKNNHGVYVALGELALARRLMPLAGMDIVWKQGTSRLERMVHSQFAPDGGHVEHSPDYHRMLLATFRGAMEAGLIDNGELRRRLIRADEILDWMIQPNGELVQVGDSTAYKVKVSTLATDRAIDTPQSQQLLVLPDTGYAIVRSPQHDRRDRAADSYLFLAAGFHSQTHKHADDLTITWFDRGHEILIDAGRYGYVDLLPKDSPARQQGYFYGAPERQYVESTRAHNTVETDGLDHDRRDRKPYGSAIRDVESRDGYFRLEAAVGHGHWCHVRTVIFKPGDWLYVIDAVESLDGREHDYRAWWNFPGEIGLTSEVPTGVRVESIGMDPLWVVELNGGAIIPPVKAQDDPMRGWRSKRDLELTPAWSTGFEVLRVKQHTFRTVFHFGQWPAEDAPDHPFGN